jgi:pre-rRNA-processing protein TSR4
MDEDAPPLDAAVRAASIEDAMAAPENVGAAAAAVGDGDGDANDSDADDSDSDDDDDAPVPDAYDSDDDDADSDDDDAGVEWNIGFVEECPPLELSRQLFPSKVGGRPAYVNPVDVPTEKQLKCLYTREPLDFLLQVYAPDDDEPTAFHRAIYVFTSPHGGDLHRPGATRAFRSQMRRDNPFYPDEPASPGGPLQELTDAQQAAYDARGDRWAVRPTDVGAVVRAPRTYPEYELVVEPEELDDGDDDGGDGGGGETASHTTPFAWCTPFLKDFSRRHSSPAFPFQRLTGKTFD